MLTEPTPLVMVKEWKESSTYYAFSVWTVPHIAIWLIRGSFYFEKYPNELTNDRIRLSQFYQPSIK